MKEDKSLAASVPPDPKSELRWSSRKGEEVWNPKVNSFIEDVLAVCRKHGLSISHEDRYGAFTVEYFDQKLADWLQAAHDETIGGLVGPFATLTDSRGTHIVGGKIEAADERTSSPNPADQPEFKPKGDAA
jgi:hypothetical protein